MKSIIKFILFVPATLTLVLLTFSFQAHARDVKIIISDYGYHTPDYYSDYNYSRRLYNKHYFDNRHRRVYGNRYNGKRYYRNNFQYYNRNQNLINRYYCPY